MDTPIDIKGFLKDPRRDARGGVDRGRFTCPGVQWAGSSADRLATFTITADQLADAADNRLLWTDQDVQRGARPEVTPSPPKELALADGYPDPNWYVFDAAKADDIVDKLLAGEKLFLSPLVWNLRPGTFSACWDDAEQAIYFYQGRFFLPDSHHRQQAIIKAVKLWREAPREYRKFSGEKQFKVELYFLGREDEGNYFFDKNQLSKATAKSKAYDLTMQDDLSLLAKEVIVQSEHLSGNVNRVTDKLTAKNPHVITLSTLREMMKTFSASDYIESTELAGMAAIAGQFYDMLATVRPELGRLPVMERKHVRETKIVDSAVMMHGYAALMKDYNTDLVRLGASKARAEWRRKLERLRSTNQYSFGKQWSGDLFEKADPLWQKIGVVKAGRDGGRLTVLNTGAARSECGKVLRELGRADCEQENWRCKHKPEPVKASAIRLLLCTKQKAPHVGHSGGPKGSTGRAIICGQF
jgi:hypothetical protein